MVFCQHNTSSLRSRLVGLIILGIKDDHGNVDSMDQRYRNATILLFLKQTHAKRKKFVVVVT
jgi:hypothetical protein